MISAEKFEVMWVRQLDGHVNGRPFYDYHLTIGDVNFHITRSTDGGFGVSVYDRAAKQHLTRNQIDWCRALHRCKSHALKIARKAGLVEPETTS
jgi:hypothetical protein